MSRGQITAMEAAIVAMVGNFHHYALSDDSHCKMNVEEFKKMAAEQFPNFSQGMGGASGMEQLMKDLDNKGNGDGQMDFKEFMCMMCVLSDCFHQVIEELESSQQAS